MRPSHRYLLAAIVVAVILVSVLAAPTLARTTLAEAQAQASGARGSAHGDLGDDSAATLADESNMTNTTMTATPTATVTTTSTSGQGSSSQGDGMTASGHQFVPYTGTPYAVPGKIEAENYDRGLCQEGTSGQGGSGTGPTPTATVTPTTTTTSGQGSSGQGTGNATNMTSLTILEPTGTAMVSGPDVTVMVKVTNFSVVDKQGEANVAGEGHIHFYMDVSPIPNTPGEPAIPTNTSAAWAHVSGTSHTFMNVTPGMHTFTAQLVNNDHTPYIPMTEQSVTVEVGEAGNATNMTTATTTATTATTTSSSSSYSAAGAIVMAANGGSQPGAEPGKYTCAQGFAYFDRSPGNQGGAYRQDDVDIEAGGTGHVVAFVKSSEWLIYSIHVPENGMYRATFHASSPWNDRQIWVWVDGILEAQVRVKNTGSFDTYEDVSADVALPVGNHYIRLEFVSDAQNLDYMTFERVGSIPTWPFFGTAGTVTPTPTSTQGGGGANVTPTATVTPTPTSTEGGGGANVTPTPTVNVTPTATVNVTPTPTSTQGGGGANVTPTPTIAAGAPPEAIQYAADWPMPNRDYNNSRATTNSPITAANVNTLGLTWAYNLTGVGTYGAGASNPIILGDTIYFQDLKANVIALNRTTGTVKWLNEYNASFVEGPNGPTAGWGKIFVAKDAYSMAALDITTGDELWENRISFVNTTGIDIAPAAYDNMVYTSTVPGTGDLFYAPGGIGYIYGLDQATGDIRWNVSTVDTPDLWGHPEVNSGGGCWYTPAIDTMTGMMFWGIANPAPFPGTKEWPSGSSRPGPNLYTNSMMALDHTTGAMDWFTQVLPHDLFDHDLQIAPILASATINGTSQEIVLGAGKMGTVYAFNRSTGALLWKTNVGDHVNDTLQVLPNGTTAVQPAVIGGVETPMAFADGVVYVPVINAVTNWTPTSIDLATFNLTAGTGELDAIDVNTGQILWVAKLDAINVGSAMVVNDLVFTATFDGTIYAFNRADGTQVWTYKAPSAINGWPAVAGNTLVWPAGGGGAFGNNATPQLLAFGLPGGNVTPTPTSTQGGGGANVTPTETMVMTTVPTTTVTTAATTTATTTAGGSTTVALTAQNIAFSTSTITVPAGASVTVNFNNMDSGVPHNFAVYTDSSATTPIFQGQVVTGPATMTYTFTAPSTPGTYFFRCDIHPTIMTGSFIVT